MVEQLADQVKIALFQDERTELEMFESLEDGPFEMPRDGNSRLFQQESFTLARDSKKQTQYEPRSTSTAIKGLQSDETELDKVDTSDGKVSSSPDGQSHAEVHTAKEKWHQTAVTSNSNATGYDQLATLIKTPDANSAGHGQIPAEDRYRLCYTIELSDSSSQEDEETTGGDERCKDVGFPGIPQSYPEATALADYNGIQCASFWPCR